MKLLRPALLGLLTVLCASASMAQSQPIWKWRDADGRLQISDRAPPPSVPDKDILQRPGHHPAAADSASEAASAPAGTDPELDARKRRLLQEAAAQKNRQLAEKQQQAAAREARLAEACQRARNQLQLLQSGARMARANDKGEREYLDDAGRAAEISRTQRQIDESCR